MSCNENASTVEDTEEAYPESLPPVVVIVDTNHSCRSDNWSDPTCQRDPMDTTRNCSTTFTVPGLTTMPTNHHGLADGILYMDYVYVVQDVSWQQQQQQQQQEQKQQREQNCANQQQEQHDVHPPTIDAVMGSTAEEIVPHQDQSTEALLPSKAVEVDERMMIVATSNNEDDHHHHRHSPPPNVDDPRTDHDCTNTAAHGASPDHTSGAKSTSPIAGVFTNNNDSADPSLPPSAADTTANEIPNDLPPPPSLLGVEPFSSATRTTRHKRRPILVPPKVHDSVTSTKAAEIDEGIMATPITTTTSNEDHHRHSSSPNADGPRSDHDRTKAAVRGDSSPRTNNNDTVDQSPPLSAADTTAKEIPNDSPPLLQPLSLLGAEPSSRVDVTASHKKRPILVPPKAQDSTKIAKRPRLVVVPEEDVSSPAAARRVTLPARSPPNQVPVGGTSSTTLRRLDTQQPATQQQLVRNIIHVEKSAVPTLLASPQSFKYCGSCLACSRARCTRCWLCQAPFPDRSSSNSTSSCTIHNNACVFRCCVINSDETKKLIIASLDKMLVTSKDPFGRDMRVYIGTPRKKTESPWWGTITGKGRGRHAVWTVKKDGHTKNQNDKDISREECLWEKDVMDEYEFVLRQEKHRLAKECELEPATNEKYSRRKVVGARCYARTRHDNLWYWGVITQRAGRWYSILLDNGVRLDKVIDLDLELETNALLRLQQAVQLRRAVFKHDLLGKGYHRKWLDASWHQHEVVGRIVKCWAGNGPDNEKLFFTVEYCSLSLSAHKHLPSADHNVAEFSAWGGYVSFQNYMQTPASLQPPFFYSWVLPCTPTVIAASSTQIEGVDLSTLELRHQGFALQLSIKKSIIAGAGFGLWMYCKRLSFTPPKAIFTLPAGHLLHIGTYGPLDDLDLKTDVVYAAKNFIHFGAASLWAYDCASHQVGYVDMTDDWTGQLRAAARQSLVAYTNEQIGTAAKNPRSKMCVIARPDPCGMIHYYIGNEAPNDNPVELPADVAIELLMNYGPGYEKVRGTGGYKSCKLEGKEDRVQKANERQDIQYILSRINEYSIANCNELLGYLTRLFSMKWDSPASKRLRAFAVLLAIYNRLRSFTEVNLPMITTTDCTIVKQCKDLVLILWAGWPKEQCLASVLTAAHPLLQDVMVSAFGGSEVDWINFVSLDAAQVHELLN